MTTTGTTRRSVRISDELWEAATSKAEAMGLSVSDILRAALERFVEES
jgi:antitoxin component of RelBE/YafQ-DinJ toxin-antitoxin module